MRRRHSSSSKTVVRASAGSPPSLILDLWRMRRVLSHGEIGLLNGRCAEPEFFRN
jgi:hypothetical protein